MVMGKKEYYPLQTHEHSWRLNSSIKPCTSLRYLSTHFLQGKHPLQHALKSLNWHQSIALSPSQDCHQGQALSFAALRPADEKLSCSLFRPVCGASASPSSRRSYEQPDICPVDQARPVATGVSGIYAKKRSERKRLKCAQNTLPSFVRDTACLSGAEGNQAVTMRMSR
jgi:hypothetical protein